jgi:predicted MFS family arabinose efflux permease
MSLEPNSFQAIEVVRRLKGLRIAGADVVEVSPPFDRTTRGIRIYLATPRLRGLLALNLAAAAAGAMVLVNTVVLVRGSLELSESALAWTMFGFGAGSMTAAPVLPRLLDALPDRPVMFGGAFLMVTTLVGLGVTILALGLGWSILLAAWLLVGLGYSAVLTPSGRLLRRSSHAEDRPALVGLALLAAIGVLVAAKLWPASDPEELGHRVPYGRPR